MGCRKTSKFCKERYGEGPSRHSVIGYMNGSLTPSVHNLILLADTFRVPVDYFFSEVRDGVIEGGTRGTPETEAGSEEVHDHAD